MDLKIQGHDSKRSVRDFSANSNQGFTSCAVICTKKGKKNPNNFFTIERIHLRNTENQSNSTTLKWKVNIQLKTLLQLIKNFVVKNLLEAFPYKNTLDINWRRKSALPMGLWDQAMKRSKSIFLRSKADAKVVKICICMFSRRAVLKCLIN